MKMNKPNKIVENEALLNLCNNDLVVWTLEKASRVYKYIGLFI